MEIEIQGIPQSLRPAYQTRIKASKADLTRYKKLSKDLHAQLSRAELLARPGAGGAPAADVVARLAGELEDLLLDTQLRADNGPLKSAVEDAVERRRRAEGRERERTMEAKRKGRVWRKKER